LNNCEIGKIGEDAVAYYLDNLGCRILDRNYRTERGEIDIIFMEDTCLVFGEVKTRNSVYYGRPCQAVDYKKRKKIINTAKNYILCQNIEHMDIRFDVFEVYFKSKKIVHIRGAYES